MWMWCDTKHDEPNVEEYLFHPTRCIMWWRCLLRSSKAAHYILQLSCRERPVGGKKIAPVFRPRYCSPLAVDTFIKKQKKQPLIKRSRPHTLKIPGPGWIAAKVFWLISGQIMKLPFSRLSALPDGNLEVTGHKLKRGLLNMLIC